MTAGVFTKAFMCMSQTHLGVSNGQGINPDPPTSPFVFDCMVEQDPEDVVDHLSYFLLLWVLGVDVSEGEHPVLPHRALQQAAGTNHNTLSKLGCSMSFKSQYCNCYKM